MKLTRPLERVLWVLVADPAAQHYGYDLMKAAKLPSGTVHVAFFDRSPEAQEPSYEVGMRYWENGVADDLSMDFGNFVMAGKLSQLKILPSHC